ncbi:DUF4190 domain-containing protein [Streptomyces longwoodensis]|uniref:DUF4190 domain-containing protein n=1 Tax=Streptomyces longwoodensis TaxID=68231 RepID=UPI00368D6C2C
MSEDATPTGAPRDARPPGEGEERAEAPVDPFAPPADPFAPPAGPDPFAPPAGRDPFAPPAGPDPSAPPADRDPFAPPAGAAPFAPPVTPAPGPAAPPPPNGPYTPYAGYDPYTPYGGAPHPVTPNAPQDGAVPPPPLAPGGPGQVPYGYPGGPGFPPPHGYSAGPGAPVPYGWPGMLPPSNGMGTAALVCGIVSAVGFCLWPLAIVLGVLAVIFGVMGRAKAARGEATNPGHALAGIICGAAGLISAVGVVLLLVLS